MTDQPTESTAPTLPTDPTVPVAGARRGPRMRTIVFGLVLLAVAVTVLVSALTTVRVDPASVALTVLIGAGALLVMSGIRSAARQGRRPAA